ncbi:MBL fold metallo-hydrolase [Shewanella sp.]|uniref:MBL fold metallo-hydrolase n=1 Tax=Shewanella sp. TaxID=50422 RepID=UPI0025CC4B94|nr:MBL fold metallo-hydrolase [Shewanella sp.]
MFMLQREIPSDPSSISYLLGCASQGKAIAVDVHLDDIEWYIAQAKEKEVNIHYVIDTHVHADHYSGGKALAALTGAQYMLHESSETHFEFVALADQQIIKAGNVEVKVLHTPGHTLDSICLLVTDRSRGPHPWFLLSQHTLFVGSVGRPDLRGQELAMAGRLYDTIHDKLLTLDSHIEIHPGAKAGSACGAGISAKPVSTIGYEKLNNPILSLSKADFITEVIATLPPHPEDMTKIVEANMVG